MNTLFVVMAQDYDVFHPGIICHTSEEADTFMAYCKEHHSHRPRNNICDVLNTKDKELIKMTCDNFMSALDVWKKSHKYYGIIDDSFILSEDVCMVLEIPLL